MPSACSQHADQPAAYRCDGCSSLLCERCVDEGHALLLCRHCGELAVPLVAAQPRTAKERKRLRQLNKKYTFWQALGYPLRGNSIYMFIATMLTLGFMWFITVVGGCLALILSFLFFLLIIGLQFKIVRTTAEGADELPDWPEYGDFAQMVLDLLTYLVIQLLQFGPIFAFVMGIGITAFTAPPNLFLWIGVTLCLWLGTALTVMAWGAAGAYSRAQIFAIHKHLRGFFVAGSDAIIATNIVFYATPLLFLLRVALEGGLPLLGAALSSIVGTYWIFTVPHLSGVVFRRHAFQLDKVYGS